MVGNIVTGDSKTKRNFPLPRVLKLALTALVATTWILTYGATSGQAQGTSSVVLNLTIDPTTPSTIYASTVAQGVFKSTNGGSTWMSASTGLSGDATAIAIDKNNPSILYAGTLVLDPNNPTVPLAPGNMYKTTNGGGSWSSFGLDSHFFTSVKIDPQDSSTIFAGTYEVFILGVTGGVYRYGLLGWVLTLGSPNTPLCLAIDSSSNVYTGTDGAGVYKRAPGVLTSWVQMTTGLGNLSVGSLAVNPSNASVIYAGTVTFLAGVAAQGIFKTVDGGSNWAPMNTGLPSGEQVPVIAIDPMTPDNVYIGTSSGLYKSANGGGNWTLWDNGIAYPIINGVPFRAVTAIAVDPLTPTTLYAGTSGAGVFKSIDGGANWTPTAQAVKKRRAQTISQ